jgi:Na+-driven multidrug efflux pump
MLALGIMVVSTGLGSAIAVLLMVATPLGDTVNGIWWALAMMLVIRGLVFLVGYRRSAETAVRS